MAKKRKAKENKRTLLYDQCEPLHPLGVWANPNGENPRKIYKPTQKKSNLTEEEMDCILKDLVCHKQQIKDLKEVIKQLNETIDSLKSKQILPSEPCSAESSVSMEILEDGLSRDKRAELVVVNSLAVKQLAARNEELNKKLNEEKKVSNDLRKEIKNLKKQEATKIRKIEFDMEKYLVLFQGLKKDFGGNAKLAMKQAR